MLLASQLVIIVIAVAWQTRTSDDVVGPLFQFDRTGEVDRITVTSGERDVVTLVKAKSGWQLPDHGGLPADPDKLTTLLDKLGDAYASWPVATSASSAKRFEVGEDNFQRRIEVSADDENLVDLYTGTSPGFRKVHARRADDDDIYAITFANYEAPALADEWLDKTLLQVEGEISAISGNDWRLEKDDAGWQLAALAEGEATDLERSAEIANKLDGLRVTGVETNTAWLADAQPRIVLTVTTDEGDVTFEWFRAGEEGDFVVKRSGFDMPFTVAEYNAESLVVTRADLVSAEVVAEAAPEEEVATEGG
jgi:hypothetical protein